MNKPYIPTEAVHNFCKSLGLYPNWANMRLCWDLLVIARMELSDIAAAIKE